MNFTALEVRSSVSTAVMQHGEHDQSFWGAGMSQAMFSKISSVEKSSMNLANLSTYSETDNRRRCQGSDGFIKKKIYRISSHQLSCWYHGLSKRKRRFYNLQSASWAFELLCLPAKSPVSSHFLLWLQIRWAARQCCWPAWYWDTWQRDTAGRDE